MAFDNATRNRLNRFVNDARGVLVEEFQRQLESDYGMTPKTGEVAELERLKHLDDAKLETARVLRDILAHYLANSPESGPKARKAAIERIAREQAFTVLNRLCAFRMMEARGIIRPAVSQGYESQAFQLFQRVAGGALGDTGQTYQAFLASLCDEFAAELKLLFNRFTTEGRLFPREHALLEVLELVNHAELEPLWAEDETIGWIYQYFNSAEERKAMRKASGAPRNSRELAVRNQFFTPRYVVEFLVDNTLGRMWWEATGGKTELYDRCQYLLVKPDENAESKEKLRDPRTIKLLDPACGSMHFGLYAFDLFEVIYREAWAWQQEHGPDSLDRRVRRRGEQQRGEKTELLEHLAEKYEDGAALAGDIPRLIIEHNIHGVDIDPRAAQIATLALWLRAQRSWHDAGISAGDRPAIGRSNVLAAVAPPAERELREQFAKRLNQQDAELFEQTLQMLKGLPELGVLLKVEEELPALVRKVFAGKGDDLFAEEEQAVWLKAEERLRAALKDFARAATSTHQGRLFAQDALEGLRLVDIVDEVFDVVVMNPPFGVAPNATFKKLKRELPTVYTELYAAFVKRGLDLISSTGRLGAITSRSFLYTGRLQDFRRTELESRIDVLLDLGQGVMDDAFVEACAYTVTGASNVGTLTAIDAKATEAKIDLKESIREQASAGKAIVFEVPWSRLSRAPANKFLYYLPAQIFDLLSSQDVFEPSIGTVRQGMGTFDDFRFLRLFWEVSSAKIGRNLKWEPLAKGGPYAKYYGQIHLLVNWEDGGAQLCEVNRQKNGQTAQVRQASDYWRLGGCTYSKRSVKGFSARAFPKQCIMAGKGPAIISQSEVPEPYFLGWLNSRLITGLIQLQANASEFNTGILKTLPWISPPERILESVSEMSRQASIRARELHALNETDPYYSFRPICFAPLQTQLAEIGARQDFLTKEIFSLDAKITGIIDEIYNVDSSMLIDGACDDLIFDGNNYGQSSIDTGIRKNLERDYCALLVSGAIGTAFGRWQPQLLLKDSKPPIISDPFDDLPFTQPGRWTSQDISQASGKEIENAQAEHESLRPINFADTGILVDDHSSHFDIERQIHQILQLVWDEDASGSESLLCSNLGYDNLRSYVADSAGFFSDHLSAYSMSRRKAPIYWPLSTASGDYTLWIYYPALTSQTLYTAVNDFVDPKLKGVAAELTRLRQKGADRSSADEERFAGLGGSEAELQDLRTTLLETAERYRPNQDDGVQITAAPLWPLFRHKPWQKLLKETWEELKEGKYDWAHLAMAYWPQRVVRTAHTDRSIAIAHDLENELWQEAEVEDKRRKTKTEWQPRDLTDNELDLIVMGIQARRAP